MTERGTYMPFGESQLSPGSIGILPLIADHPSILQHTTVRASRRLSSEFTLSTTSSPGFGSAPSCFPTTDLPTQMDTDTKKILWQSVLIRGKRSVVEYAHFGLGFPAPSPA